MSYYYDDDDDDEQSDDIQREVRLYVHSARFLADDRKTAKHVDDNIIYYSHLPSNTILRSIMRGGDSIITTGFAMMSVFF